MSPSFDSLEAAFLALSDPGDPRWAEAFGFLSQHPETAPMILDAFRDTLEQMGVEGGGTDPETGEPMYTLDDVARALGIAPEDLDPPEGTP